MNINSFFTSVLGAQLKNTRWSWGARDPVMNRVFLRVWRDQIERVDGAEWVRIGYGQSVNKSNGLPERKNHIELLRAGAEGFGVICTPKEPVDDKSRTIRSFDAMRLARFGSLRVDGQFTLAKIDEFVPVSALVRAPSSSADLAADLRAINRMQIDSTTREVLTNARLGQGQFRADVLRAWDGACAVSGAKVVDAIRASHIKPWRLSTNCERLDASNGLPLLATLDSLFDVGLITFSADGVLMPSSSLGHADVELLNLRNSRLRRTPDSETSVYLEFHRESIFKA